jgi:hypothetical protein
MKLREAKERIERERPDLRGTAKIEAIKALREQPATDEPAEAKVKEAESEDRYCNNCSQPVKPVVSNGLGAVLSAITLMQAAAVLASLAAVMHRPPTYSAPFSQLALWPAQIHPSGLGVLAAVAAFITTGSFTAKANSRAEAAAICPICKSTLRQQQ